MELLLESPLAVAALGGFTITCAAIVFGATRGRVALAGVILAVLFTVVAVVGERLYQTPRERVASAVGGLFDAIRANNLRGVLAFIDPTATDVIADAESLMPRFRVMAAGVGGEVRVTLADNGTAATASLKPVLKVTHKQSGATVPYSDRLDLDWVDRGDGRWLLSAYQAAKDWREEASRLSR